MTIHIVLRKYGVWEKSLSSCCLYLYNKNMSAKCTRTINFIKLGLSRASLRCLYFLAKWSRSQQCCLWCRKCTVTAVSRALNPFHEYQIAVTITASKQYNDSALPFVRAVCRLKAALLCIGQINRSREVRCSLPSSTNGQSKWAKQTVYDELARCRHPGEPVPERWNQSGFYWSKRQWVAVAPAGPYASLHLAPDR